MLICAAVLLSHTILVFSSYGLLSHIFHIGSAAGSLLSYAAPLLLARLLDPQYMYYNFLLPIGALLADCLPPTNHLKGGRAAPRTFVSAAVFTDLQQ